MLVSLPVSGLKSPTCKDFPPAPTWSLVNHSMPEQISPNHPAFDRMDDGGRDRMPLFPDRAVRPLKSTPRHHAPETELFPYTLGAIIKKEPRDSTDFDAIVKKIDELKARHPQPTP